MNGKRILENIGISMFMKPISMLLSLIYTPMALNFLGEAKYGIWAIILNIITWINIFDIGIGNGLRNKLTGACASDDKESAQIYVSTAYLGTGILAVSFFIITNMIWRLFNLSNFFNLGIEDENIDFIILISIFFVCVNFILALSKTSAYAIHQSGGISVANTIGQIIQIIIIFILSRITRENLLAVAVMYGIASLAENIIIYISLTRKRRYLIPHIKLASKAYMKNLMTLGIGFFVMQICSIVLNTTDNLLISNLFGSSEVTPYNIVYKVFYMFVTVHSIILLPMWSAYTEAAIRNDLQWIKNMIKKINFITVIFSIGVIVVIFLFEPFTKVWLGRELHYGKELITITAFYMLAQMFANNYSAFLCGVSCIKISSMLSIIGAIINIPLSIIFAKTLKMNLSGIILGSLCVMSISTIILPLVSHQWIISKEKNRKIKSNV